MVYRNKVKDILRKCRIKKKKSLQGWFYASGFDGCRFRTKAVGDKPVFDYAMQSDAVRLMEMELKEVSTTEQSKTFTLYMNFLPVDMQGHQVYAVLHGTDNRVYQDLLVSKTLVSGNIISMLPCRM